MNNKPNYNRGKTRYQIMNLMHITGAITPRSFKLFDNWKSVTNTMSLMRKEGVVEKVHNKTTFDALSLSDYRNNYEKYFYENFPDMNLEYFERYTKKNINRAKYDSTGKKEERLLKDSEIITMMYAAGIPTLPDDKKMVVQSKTLTDNVYYTSREIRKYSGFEPDVRTLNEGKQKKANKLNDSVVVINDGYEFYAVARQSLHRESMVRC